MATKMKRTAGAMPAGMYADGGKVGKRSMPVTADGTRGPGVAAGGARQDMKKMANGGKVKSKC